ncbi:gamma-glutamylcyclotransferase [Emcibacter sp. SYSU 3D8]|uniref:gamma-glutamylcyclotransferase n=1 Tax=Emcibacter sp. SYSU 3D8 TaxID=3133969 RepID=UPI0031FF0190
MAEQDNLWVFGYGSLMWRPGFDYLEAQPARLHGFHRSFCVYSWHHRGTRQQPGLVLGLDRGGSCLGRAYRIAPENAGAVVDYLDEREMVTAVYRPVRHVVRLPGRMVAARAYVVDRGHPQYAGKLSLEEQARQIDGARGVSGVNIDYLASTVAHLDEMGISDGPLHRVWRLLGAPSA